MSGRDYHSPSNHSLCLCQRWVEIWRIIRQSSQALWCFSWLMQFRLGPFLQIRLWKLLRCVCVIWFIIEWVWKISFLNPFLGLRTPEWYSTNPSSPSNLAHGLRFLPQPEPSQRLAAHTPSGVRMLQDTGCGNNVTRVLPLGLLKSGFADCLFEGKEASDKHPVLKSCLGFVAV